MTGFARADREQDGLRVRVEVKSVNGRGLDMRLRLAPGLDIVELPLRQAISRTLSRGSVNLSVSLDRTGSKGTVRVNQEVLASVLAALDDLGTRLPAAPPRLDGVLAIPGVLESDSGQVAADEDRIAALVLECANNAIARLQAARVEEGSAIATALLGQIDAIEQLVSDALADPSRSREAIEARLREQVAALGADVAVAPDRLAQEVLLLATKADIQEELDRLSAHVAAARKLIAQGGPVGRRLDFLAQEFNREANTLCSKSNAVSLTAIGLDLKAVIDQLREQVQNIE